MSELKEQSCKPCESGIAPHSTMSFVNALAHIANAEDHHPDLEVGYDYCNVTFTTHAIQGLSANLCSPGRAAKKAELSAPVPRNKNATTHSSRPREPSCAGISW